MQRAIRLLYNNNNNNNVDMAHSNFYYNPIQPWFIWILVLFSFLRHQTLFCLKFASSLLLFFAPELVYCLLPWLDSGWQDRDNPLVKKATSLQTGLQSLTFALSGAQHGYSLWEAVTAAALRTSIQNRKESLMSEMGVDELSWGCLAMLHFYWGLRSIFRPHSVHVIAQTFIAFP